MAEEPCQRRREFAQETCADPRCQLKVTYVETAQQLRELLRAHPMCQPSHEDLRELRLWAREERARAHSRLLACDELVAECEYQLRVDTRGGRV